MHPENVFDEEVNANTGHLENVEKMYIGLRSNTMKSRFNTHPTTFRHKSYAEEATLSGAFWKMKMQFELSLHH